MGERSGGGSGFVGSTHDRGMGRMRGVIVYESYYGNTKIVADAIAEELKSEGHEAEVRDVREKHLPPPQGDILFLGSPIRLGSVTRKMRKFVDKLDAGPWRGKPIVVFTTILQLPENATDKQKESRERYDIPAGGKLGEIAKSKGLEVMEDRLWVEVKGLKGPLVETGVQKTKEFVRNLLIRIRDGGKAGT